MQVSNNGTDWTDIAEISHPSVPISYGDRWEAVPVRQTASWASGVTWSDNHGEKGVGTYARGFEYDKVGNRSLMHLLDNDGDFVRDVTWMLEYNDFNQLDKRYTGASWTSGTFGGRRNVLCRESFLGTRFSRIPIRNVRVPMKPRMLKRGTDSLEQKEIEGIHVPAVDDIIG